MAFGGETAESYYDEGLTASMKGETGQAIAHFQRALELDPRMSAAQHQLGKCYHRQGDLAKALDLLQRAVTAKPAQIPPRLDLGYALLESGKTEQAERVFGEILHVKPDNSRAQLGLAYCAFEKAQWETAMQHAQAATLQTGANFAAFFLLGRAARLSGRPEVGIAALQRAETLIEKSIETSPDQPEGYYLRGEVQFVQEQFAAALDSFRAAEEHARPGQRYASYGEHFTRLDILARRGVCLQRLGRGEEARAVGAQILAEDPAHKLGQALAQG
jgi:tetratricopeptide (TPR) repeat protein